ncbi:hypothetical protein AJ87_08835 [Rhizobium yanglingense]|nr:hypothetical protein AJ87_08835 [Rhizobium yanglingense]
MGLPSEVMEIAMSTPPEEMHYFSRTELQNFQLLNGKTHQPFAERESRSLNITVDAFRERRKAYLKDPTRNSCLTLQVSARDMCLYATLAKYGLSR